MLVAQSCLALCNLRDYSPPDSSIHGILQQEWVAIPFSRGSSQPREWTQVSCIAGRFFTIWTTRETHYSTKPISISPYQEKCDWAWVEVNKRSLGKEIQFSSPQPFWHHGLVSWKTVFPWTGLREGGCVDLGMTQAHHIYCTLYFYYDVSSTSSHQALDPGGWEPLQ